MQGNSPEFFNRFRQARPFLVGQRAGAQMRLVNPANRTHDTHGQLGSPHFHRKHSDRQTFVQGDMLGDIDGQRRFSHRGPGGQNDQVTGLKAGSHAVQIDKTGRHTRDIVRVFRHLGDTVQQVHHQRVHALKTLLRASALLADVQNFLLSLIQNDGDGLALRVEGIGRNFIRRRHQLAQDRALPDDFGITPNVAGARHILRQ